MPNTKSAEKAVRQSEKNRIRNYIVRKNVKEIIKEFLLLVKNKKTDEAKVLINKAFSIIDKAAKTYVLHKNNAGRKKARLSRLLAKMERK